MCCAFAIVVVTLAQNQEATLNGNAAYAAAPVEEPQFQEPQLQQQQPLPVQQQLSEQTPAEEPHEDLDTEVSQINTQSKTQSSEPAESYSRPMSRTSSMTPVNSWHTVVLLSRPPYPFIILLIPSFYSQHFAGYAG